MSEEIKNLNNEPEQAPVEKTEAKKPLDKKTIAIIAGVAAVVIVAIILILALGGKKDYTLGMGVAFGDINDAQVNATIATVIVDKDGKIVECRIDAIQNKYAVADGKVNFSVLDTKMELGDKYNMAAFGKPNVEGGTVKEWYDQAKAFEAYVVGMTAAEVEAIETQFVNNHHIAKDEALLSAGCTIQITDFKAAVVKACKDDQAVSFKANPKKMTLGIAANNADDGSSITDGVVTVKLNSDIAATVVVDGKIVATINDAIQPQVSFNPEVKDADGKVIIASKSVGKGEGILKTKRELKEDYKMAAFGKPNVEGGTVKEWYVQSAAFSAYVEGMTADQVKGLETKEVNNHLISTDDALLSAGCTMQITGIMAVVAESMEYAR